MQVLRKQLEETKARQVPLYTKIKPSYDIPVLISKKNLILLILLQLAEASNRKDLEDIVMNLQKELCKAGPESTG
jgi:hypothetical protein